VKTKPKQGFVTRQLETLNEELRDFKDDALDYIARQPVKAALISFGIGVLAGAMLMKSKEKR